MWSVLVAGVLAFLHTLPWSILFYFSQFVGVRLYVLTQRDECTRIQKRVHPYSSHFTDDDKSCGYSFGMWYALHIHCDRNESCQVTMIATVHSYSMLTQRIDTKPSRPLLQSPCFYIYERVGNYSNPWFRKREQTTSSIPSKSQQTIVDSIVDAYLRDRKVVVLLYGPPGTGKSMVGLLLANYFKSFFCNTLKPWQPGETYGGLYMEVEPSFRKPLITVFDEMDATFLALKNGIKQHESIPTSVADKQGWNHLLDEIQRFMYPDTILLLTSNKKPAEIHAIDESFIRKRRVNLMFELTEVFE